MTKFEAYRQSELFRLCETAFASVMALRDYIASEVLTGQNVFYQNNIKLLSDYSVLEDKLLQVNAELKQDFLMKWGD